MNATVEFSPQSSYRRIKRWTDQLAETANCYPIAAVEVNGIVIPAKPGLTGRDVRRAYFAQKRANRRFSH